MVQYCLALQTHLSVICNLIWTLMYSHWVVLIILCTRVHIMVYAKLHEAVCFLSLFHNWQRVRVTALCQHVTYLAVIDLMNMFVFRQFMGCMSLEYKFFEVGSCNSGHTSMTKLCCIKVTNKWVIITWCIKQFFYLCIFLILWPNTTLIGYPYKLAKYL